MPDPNGTPGLIIEQITDDQILTWEEATNIQTKRLFLPKFGKYVIYRTMIPLDVMARIQAQHAGKRFEDVMARYVAILKYVLINPAVKTPEAERALVKADSATFFEVMNDVLSKDQADEIKDGLSSPQS